MLIWLVINHFMQTEALCVLYELFEKMAAAQGFKMQRISNLEATVKLADPLFQAPKTVLFWDKDVRLAALLEARGACVFNTAKAIEVCDDKSLTAVHLANSGISMPKTMRVPMSFHVVTWEDNEFVTAVEQQLGFPCVLKACYGSYGEQVQLIESSAHLIAKLTEVSPIPHIVQEFIAQSAGRDVRIQVVGNKVIAAMQRNNTGNFISNVTAGGSVTIHTPSKEESELALTATKMLGLDFAGVDILFGKKGPVLCEVNSNAHFKTLLNLTGVNTAEHIINHIADHMQR